MNIVVVTFSKHVTVRSDTTWERINRDFFVPDFVDGISCSPVVFANIMRPGKSIRSRFASRYFDGVGYGVLLYPDSLYDGSVYSIAAASCLNHTSFLYHPAQPVTSLPESRFTLLRGDEVVFDSPAPSLEIIGDAVSRASEICFLRNGDLVAVELADIFPLCDKSCRVARISGGECGNGKIDFKIIY